MSVSGDVSDQVVRFYLEGFEVLARLSGTGAKAVAKALYKTLKSEKPSKGKTKLINMLKTGKPLKIFTIQKEDLKVFSKEAKKYGISYCVLKDKTGKDLDGVADILVNAEDAPRVNRVVQRFNLTTIDTAEMKTKVTKSIDKRKEEQKEKGTKEKSKEEQLEEVLSEKPMQKEENTTKNFNLAKTEKDPQSEPSSKMQEGVTKGKKEKKPSVRKELARLKVESKKLTEKKSKDKETKIVGKMVNSKDKNKKER